MNLKFSYVRNCNSDKNPLLKKDTTYYELKWKMVSGYITINETNKLSRFSHSTMTSACSRIVILTLTLI